MRRVMLPAALMLSACADIHPTGPLPLAKPQAESGPVSFAALAPGDRLEVRFVSQGCFHATEHHVVFTHTGAHVTLHRERGTSSYGRVSHGPTGPIALAQADLAALDGELAWRRKPPAVSSTTHVAITLVHRRGGAVVAKEQLASSAVAYRQDANGRFEFAGENAALRSLLARLDGNR